RQNRRMNFSVRQACLPLFAVLALAGCGVVPNEVVPLRDGVLRAPSYRQASDYCDARGKSTNNLGRENSDNILFRCV
ncbi:hypothetical protein WB334_26430, partial [Escherichia coli]|uniref:hypothetical protein n=1 Tax=Escherichia coli TaxID=562 RepID=UPI00215747A5